MHLPEEFVARVECVFGDAGRAWLPTLPGIVARCRQKWGLRAPAMCATMSMNYIEFAVNAGGQAVALKVGVPHPELFTEMETLRLYAGRGAVRLLAADAELGAILMQRAQPGTNLFELGDNARETAIAAQVIQRMPIVTPPSHGLPTFARWVERAFRLTKTVWDPDELMPRDLIDQAEAAFSAIEGAKQTDTVLHGDLHHGNILYDEQAGWLAIDPKGVVGAPCLEVGRFLQNRLPYELGAQRWQPMVLERLRIFSDILGYPQEMLAAAGLVDCVLGHCWCFEEEALSSEWYSGVELARFLCGLCADFIGNSAERRSAVEQLDSVDG